VSHVFGSIRGSLEWNRTFAPSRSQSTVVAADSLRDRPALADGEILVPPRRREGGYFETQGPSWPDSNKGNCTMKTPVIELPGVVTRAEWLAARLKLLTKEKELTYRRDAPH
jgi:hypothetical protein